MEEETKITKSETYYWTKHGRVKGILTISDTYIMFDVASWEENYKLMNAFTQDGKKLDFNSFETKFQAWIDIQDILNVDVIKLPNETAIYIKDDDSRQSYLYDYYIQFTVWNVNARTLKKLLENQKVENKKSKRRAIATVFFRFSHRDKDGNFLKNKEQSSIVELIKNDITFKSKLHQIKEEEMKNQGKSPEESDEYDSSKYYFSKNQSITCIPYYDKIPRDESWGINEEDYDLLLDIDGNDSLVKNKSFEEEKEQYVEEEVKKTEDEIISSLPKSESFSRYRPNLADDSVIMNETQMILIGRLLPPLYRMREWVRLYSLSVDGVSLQTFFTNAKGSWNTLLFVEDTKGYKFGAYLCEEWSTRKHFYGTGESFLFTFKDTEEDIKVFKWTGYNEHIQFSDDTSIAVGGADGQFALYLRNNFLNGVSNHCKTFDNWVLSSKEDFLCKYVELWGFDY